jgi:putative alpha-1,2-mannosidase
VPGKTQLILPGNPSGGYVTEAGALFSFAGGPTQVIIRVGVSFISEEQACSNAESEIGAATFDQIQAQSKALWNERLSRIEIDVPHATPKMTELLYSSLYRASLTPVSRFPILRAGPLTCSAAHQEQCYRRGPRRFSGHGIVLF